MAYNYITNINARSFTAGRPGGAYDGTVVIHWWGDPRTNPTARGIANYFANAAPTSAHYVVSGTNREVYHLVNNTDTAYHAGNWGVNLRSIGIECDPRARDEDYDVVAEVLANIWDYYKKRPNLIGHNQVVSTQCPGAYNLGRLNTLMEQKYNAKKSPAPAPAPAKKVVPNATKLPSPKDFVVKFDGVNLWDLNTSPNYKSVKQFKKGDRLQLFGKILFDNQMYYVTEYSYNKGIKHGFNAADLEEYKAPAPAPVEPPKVEEKEYIKNMKKVDSYKIIITENRGIKPFNLEKNEWSDSLIPVGTIIDIVAETTVGNKKYLISSHDSNVSSQSGITEKGWEVYTGEKDKPFIIENDISDFVGVTRSSTKVFDRKMKEIKTLRKGTTVRVVASTHIAEKEFYILEDTNLVEKLYIAESEGWKEGRKQTEDFAKTLNENNSILKQILKFVQQIIEKITSIFK